MTPLVEAAKAPVVLGYQGRLEAAVAVARHVNPRGAVVGEHGLARRAIALVRLLGPLPARQPFASFSAYPCPWFLMICLADTSPDTSLDVVERIKSVLNNP
jgi:hypothetical protein